MVVVVCMVDVVEVAVDVAGEASPTSLSSTASPAVGAGAEKVEGAPITIPLPPSPPWLMKISDGESSGTPSCQSVDMDA